MDGVGLEALHARLESLYAEFLDRLKNVADLHSFRLCVIPADAETKRPLSVLINSVHDHPPAQHLAALIEQTGDLLVAAFARANYSGTPESLVTLIMRHRIREQTLFLGSIGRTVEQIDAEHRLRLAVQDLVAEGIKAGRWNEETPPETIRRDVRDHFLTRPPGCLARGPKSCPFPRGCFVFGTCSRHS